METFSPDDVCVFNPDEGSNRVQGFENNIGPVEDEYRPVRERTFQGKGYSDRYLISVENLRTGDITSGYWWRLKKKEQTYQYDPSQAGDTDDDI